MSEITKQNKTIDSTVWTIEQLQSFYKDIKKPKFQRKMRWTVKPTSNDKISNFKEYIDFLIKYKNSQIPIALGEYINNNKRKFSISDGNNRIHAIIYFLQCPYKTHDKYYDNIIKYIHKHFQNHQQ